jgi:hypothetical protein
LCGARDRQDWEARLVAREQTLSQAETLLAVHAREIDAERERLASQRAEQSLTARDERREMAELLQRERASLDEKRQQLELAKEAHLRQRGAVEQLHESATRMHRESLELRLVVEQMWGEISRQAPAAEVTRSLAALRQRLADNYRDAGQQLTAQKAELLELAGRLEKQQGRLVDERDQHKSWLKLQQAEIERQAARLVAREQQLQKQDQEWEAAQAEHAKERREGRERMRALLARVRELECRTLAPAA